MTTSRTLFKPDRIAVIAGIAALFSQHALAIGYGTGPSGNFMWEQHDTYLQP